MSLPGSTQPGSPAGFGSAHAASWGSDEAGDTYERSRSGYPTGLAPILAGELGIDATSVVVDVAAGTGKFTRLLRPLCRRVVAAEPAAGMRRRLSLELPDVPVVAATAERLPVAGGAVDAVTAAQAFHWFRAAEAMDEFARVVRPGGGVALVWNVDDPMLEAGAGPEGGRLAEGLKEVADRYERLRPRPRARWHDAFASAGGWGPAGQARLEGTETLTVATVVERVGSRSFALLLDPPDRSRLLAEVGEVAGAEAAGDGTVTLPTLTVIHWRRRL